MIPTWRLVSRRDSFGCIRTFLTTPTRQKDGKKLEDLRFDLSSLNYDDRSATEINVKLDGFPSRKGRGELEDLRFDLSPVEHDQQPATETKTPNEETSRQLQSKITTIEAGTSQPLAGHLDDGGSPEQGQPKFRDHRTKPSKKFEKAKARVRSQHDQHLAHVRRSLSPKAPGHRQVMNALRRELGVKKSDMGKSSNTPGMLNFRDRVAETADPEVEAFRRRNGVRIPRPRPPRVSPPSTPIGESNGVVEGTQMDGTQAGLDAFMDAFRDVVTDEAPKKLAEQRFGGFSGKPVRGNVTADAVWAKDDQANESTQSECEPTSPLEDNPKHRAVVLRGMIPNLRTTDFARVVSPDISMIGKQVGFISQGRDPRTFSSTNAWHLTFKDGDSTAAWRDTFHRAQNLAISNYENSSNVRSQIQQSSDPIPVDDNANSSSPPEEKDLANFTLTPGFAPPLDTSRERASGRRQRWADRLRTVLNLDAHSPHHPVVMVDVSPIYDHSDKNLNLPQLIRDDNVHKALKWKVSPPVKLKSSDEEKMLPHYARNRWFVACSSDEEARRFHRAFNNRLVPAPKTEKLGQERLLRTSIIEW